MTITTDLIEFALAEIDATPRARQIARLSAVDWASCGLAGWQEGSFGDWANCLDGAGPAPTFAGRDHTASQAALVNGTLSHALDYDDTHFAHIGHPSVVVFPAIFAAAPQDWNALEDAALVGVEASIHIGLWLGRDHYARGFHMTATAGAFGACIALVRMLGLTPIQAQHALGLCATMASGLKAQFGTMGKPLNAGLAARAAVEAALWAQAGMTGPTQGLEAFASAHGAEQNVVSRTDLGRTWRMETLSHKFHACCHGLHATLEALRGYDGAVPERIDLFTHPRWVDVCAIPDPRTGLEAKFSYAQVIAMSLAGIATGDIASFSDDMTFRPELMDLRSRVRVCADPDLSETQTRVTLHTQSGSIDLFHDLADAIDISALFDRIREKSGMLLGDARSDMLWSAMQKQDVDRFRAAAFSQDP